MTGDATTPKPEEPPAQAPSSTPETAASPSAASGAPPVEATTTPAEVAAPAELAQSEAAVAEAPTLKPAEEVSARGASRCYVSLAGCAAPTCTSRVWNVLTAAAWGWRGGGVQMQAHTPTGETAEASVEGTAASAPATAEVVSTPVPPEQSLSAEQPSAAQRAAQETANAARVEFDRLLAAAEAEEERPAAEATTVPSASDPTSEPTGEEQPSGQPSGGTNVEVEVERPAPEATAVVSTSEPTGDQQQPSVMPDGGTNVEVEAESRLTPDDKREPAMDPLLNNAEEEEQEAAVGPLIDSDKGKAEAAAAAAVPMSTHTSTSADGAQPSEVGSLKFNKTCKQSKVVNRVLNTQYGFAGFNSIKSLQFSKGFQQGVNSSSPQVVVGRLSQADKGKAAATLVAEASLVTVASESDVAEGDELCRLCHEGDGDGANGPLLTPCSCRGAAANVHTECLKVPPNASSAKRRTS